MIEKLKTEDWLVEEKCAEKINELIDHLNSPKPTLKDLLTDEVIAEILVCFTFATDDYKCAVRNCRTALKQWRDEL